MIKNQSRKQEIKESWLGIRNLQKNLRRLYVANGSLHMDTAPDETYNLPFVLAYSVIDNVLSELKDQGDIVCNSWMLGAKMEASRNTLPWKDYDLIWAGKEQRNQLAHDSILIDKAECVKYIDAVENELNGWGILS